MAKRGRPRKITKAILRILEDAFLEGLSDEEACLIADIGVSTLYDYCKQHPEFSERKELLKHNPKILAKRSINKALSEQDVEVSKWYLERKARDEFSVKQTTEVQGNVNLNNAFTKLTDEELRALVRDEDG